MVDNIGRAIHDRAEFTLSSQVIPDLVLDDYRYSVERGIQEDGPFFIIGNHSDPINYLRREYADFGQDPVRHSQVVLGATVTRSNLRPDTQHRNRLVGTLFDASRAQFDLDITVKEQWLRKLLASDFSRTSPANLFTELQGIEAAYILASNLAQEVPDIKTAVCNVHRVVELYRSEQQKIYLQFGSETFLAAHLPELKDINGAVGDDGSIWYGHVVSFLHPWMGAQNPLHILYKRKLVDTFMRALLETTDVATIITTRELGKTAEVFLESPFYKGFLQVLPAKDRTFYCYHLVNPFECSEDGAKTAFEDKSSDAYKMLSTTARKWNDNFLGRIGRDELRIADRSPQYTQVLEYTKNCLIEGLSIIVKNTHSLEELEVMYNTRA